MKVDFGSWSRFGEGDRWRQSARALGLVAYRSRASFDQCRDWHSMRAAVGTPMSNIYAYADLMWGSVRGVEVIAAVTDAYREDQFDSRKRRLCGKVNHVVAAIEPPLLLGLWLQPRDHTARSSVGDPNFDARYGVVCAEPENAALLFASEQRARLIAWLVSLETHGIAVEITDDHVALRQRRALGEALTDARTLGYWIGAAVELSELLCGARDQLPPSALQGEFRLAAETLANLVGAAVDVDPREPRAALGLGGCRLELRLETERGRFDTVASARLVDPVSAYLALTPLARPPSSFERLFGIGAVQGPRTGDPAFDARFAIHAADPRALLAALTPDVRARLMTITSTGARAEVIAEHARIRAWGPIVEPAVLRALAEDCAWLAGALSRGARREPGGPYR